MTLKISAVCLTVLFLAASVSGAAPFYAPSFEGTWQGTAQITTCSRPAGSTNIVLKLEDKGYMANSKVPGVVAVGSVSGYLELNGSASGVVALYYDPKDVVLKSALGSVRPVNPSPFGVQVDSAFSTYWVALKPGDASFGVGHYQSLTGTFAHADSGCPNLGDAGSVLRVTLKKR